MGNLCSVRRHQDNELETECFSDDSQAEASNCQSGSASFRLRTVRSTSDPNEQLKQRRKAFLQGKSTAAHGNKGKYRNSIAVAHAAARDYTITNSLNYERNKISPIPINLIQEQEHNSSSSTSIATNTSQETYYTARTSGKPSPDPIKQLESKVEKLEIENHRLKNMIIHLEGELANVKDLEQRFEEIG